MLPRGEGECRAEGPSAAGMKLDAALLGRVGAASSRPATRPQPAGTIAAIAGRRTHPDVLGVASVDHPSALGARPSNAETGS